MNFQSHLSAYLSRKGNTEKLLAQEVGVAQYTINRFRRGVRFPDTKTARKIDAATNGEVPFVIWQADFLARNGLTGE